VEIQKSLIKRVGMKNVDKVGVNCLSAFVAGSDFLDPMFNTDDKKISWDGTIIVFDNKERKKEFYLGTIPVQIKSVDAKEFSGETVSHEFDVSDLKNYFKNGGVLLFVVEIKNQSNKFFYSMLLPSDLKNILTKKGGKKTRYIKLAYLADDNTSQIENTCREFILHSKKQRSTIDYSIPISECAEINIPVILDNPPTPDYFFTHDFYAYGRRQSDAVETFIDKVRITEIGSTVHRPVSIDNRIYYLQYGHKKSKDEEKITLGKSVQINLTQSQITYDLQGTLREQILDCEFLIEFINKKAFFIGDNKVNFFSLNDVTNNEFLIRIKNLYGYLVNIRSLLEYFHIEPDNLDIYKGSVSKLDATSVANLDLLNKAFIKHEKITIIPEKIGFYYLQVSNLVIGVFIYRKESENFIRVVNLFDSLDEVLLTATIEDGSYTRISPYVLITKTNLLALSNLNLDYAIADIKKYIPTEFSFSYINQFGLELINSYDSSKRDEFLDAAIQLFKWLSEFSFFNEIIRINEFQIYKRQRKFSQTEIIDLFEMKEQIKSDDRLLCGISILLDNKADVKFYFSRLSQILQEEFKKYPIYSLAQQLHFFD
jgi:hypothetical protein